MSYSELCKKRNEASETLDLLLGIIEDIKDIITNDELCAEAIVSEIGELIGECE